MYRRNPPKPRPRRPSTSAIEHAGLTRYLHPFLEWCAVRAYSERTVELRRFHLQRFIRWCDERGLHQPGDITPPILERYRRHLYYHRKANGAPLSFATQAQRLLPIKAWFKWLTKEHHVPYNPASELDLPRQHRALPKHILSVSDVEQVLNQTHVHGEIGVRDRAILETLYSTGLRRMELVNLKLYDLDLNNGTVHVRQGKGKKDRYIPIGARACAWVTKYLDDIRPTLVLEPDDYSVFLTEYGQPFAKNRLTDLVKNYIDASGVNKPGACHIFRHSMATHMLENGADLRYLQAMLGHSTLATTEIYTHVSIRKLKEVHTRTHPATLKRNDARNDSNEDNNDADRDEDADTV